MDRVDFLRRMIEVDRQLIGSDHGHPVFGPPKTSASVRTVPLPTVVAEALAEHIRVYGTGQDGLLFVGDDGVAPQRPWWSRWVWRPAVASVQGAPAGTGMHDLRHFYASFWHDESVKVVQARLSHATAAETLDTYLHLWPDSDDTTRAAVDSALKITRPADSLRTVGDHWPPFALVTGLVRTSRPVSRTEALPRSNGSAPAWTRAGLVSTSCCSSPCHSPVCPRRAPPEAPPRPLDLLAPNSRQRGCLRHLAKSNGTTWPLAPDGTAGVAVLRGCTTSFVDN